MIDEKLLELLHQIFSSLDILLNKSIKAGNFAKPNAAKDFVNIIDNNFFDIKFKGEES